MKVTEDLIRMCLDHYAFDDAIILSELNFAENQTDKAAFLLATAYFRSGQYSSTYYFLKNFGVRIPETKFLFARCCEQLNKLTEAEEALTNLEALPNLECERNGQGTWNDGSAAIPFAHALLGRIYSKTNRSTQAISEQRIALAKLPFLFESYKAIRSLGGDDDASLYFNRTSISAALKSLENAIQQNAQGVDSNRALCDPAASCNITPELRVMAADTPQILPQLVLPTVQQNAGAVTCKTPYLSSNYGVPVGKLIPKAPTKNLSKGKQLDGHYNGSRIVTRQQSQRVLTQNQTKVATRRSTRLFQSSVKENENEISTLRNDKLNMSKISVVKKASRSRKIDIDKSTSSGELQKGKRIIQDVVGTVSGSSLFGENGSKCVLAKPLGEYSPVFEGLLKFAAIEAALNKYDSQKAIELTNGLLDSHQTSPLGVLSLARAYFEQANYHKAEEYFRELRYRYNYFLKGMEYYSTALWHLQKDTDLSALSQDLTQQHRHAPETWCAAGNCFSLQKENDTAIKFFQRAIQLNPDYAYAYTLLGHEYVAIEAYDQALQCFRAALRLQPRHYNAWYGIGLIYYKQEKLVLARLHLRRALEINPRNSVLMCHVSLVQQALDDKLGALKLLDEALALSPRNALCRYHKAHLLFAQDRYEEALVELNELKQLAPKEPMVYFLAGKVHKKIGQPHLALMNFSWATELDPRGEQHHPVVGDRRYDEEPVTALAATDPDEANELAMDSDDSS